MTTLGTFGRDYVAGDADAKDVIQVAQRAALSVERTKPTDPSLARTRLLINGMFVEYGRAIRARVRNRDAGTHMFRAYGLANFAHEVLAEAQPGLRERGCAVDPPL